MEKHRPECHVILRHFFTADLSVNTQKDMKFTATTVKGAADILVHIFV